MASKRSRAVLPRLLASWVVVACGKTTGAGQTRSVDGNRDAATEDSAASDSTRDASVAKDAEAVADPIAFCPNIHFGDPNRVVLAGRDGDELVFVRGSRKKIIAHHFLPGPDGPTTLTDSFDVHATTGLIGALRSAGRIEGEGFVDAALFESDGTLTWNHVVDVSSYSYVNSFELGADGAMAIDMTASDDLIVLPDGSLGYLPPLERVLTSPTNGWVAGFGEDYTPVFARGDDPALRSVTHDVAGPVGIFARNGSFFYPVVDGDSVRVARETPDRIEYVPVSVDASEIVRWRAHESWLTASVQSVLRWWMDFETGEARSVDTENLPLDVKLETWLESGVALITADGAPRLRIDLRSGETEDVSAQDLEAPEVSVRDGVVWGSREGWPLWSYGVASGGLRRHDLAIPAGLRRLTYIDGCPPTQAPVAAAVLADGGVAVALRDDRGAMLMLHDAHEGSWRQIGEPVADVASMFGYRVGTTWVVASGGDYENSFCPTEIPEPFVVAPGETPLRLSGTTMQILPEGPVEPLVFSESGSGSPQFHPSGTCVIVDETAYDLTDGSALDLGFRAAWVRREAP